MTVLAEHTDRPMLVDPQDETSPRRPRWARPGLAALLLNACGSVPLRGTGDLGGFGQIRLDGDP